MLLSIRKKIKEKYPRFHAPVSALKRKVEFILLWSFSPTLLSKFFREATFAIRKSKEFQSVPRTEINEKAILNVCTEPHGGNAQLAILIQAGCKPEHKVLEIGCGALVAGYPIMQYLNKGNYCGIEPAKWEVDATLACPETKEVVLAKVPRFAYNEDFDGISFGEQFDFIISHSIISHAADWQYPLFLQNIAKVMKKGSKALFSLYFTDGNALGSIKFNMDKATPQVKKNYYNGRYNGTEKDFTEWQYPGNSFFVRETFFENATKAGFKGEEDVVSIMIMNAASPHHKHSWVKLEKI